MTYDELKWFTNGANFPAAAVNADGENVIIERGTDFFKVTTVQHNGWTRINYIWEDDTREETFKRSNK